MKNLPTALRWVLLVLLSGLFSWGLESRHVPAAFLLGPMLVAIAFGVAGSGLRLPRLAFQGAQGIIGCLVATALNGTIVLTVLEDWAPMLAVVAATVVAAGLVGWLLARYGRLPGTTAAWGSTPGAAAAMVAMAGDYGADVRLVAFMQYLRLVMVVASASFVSSVVLGAKTLPVAAHAPAAMGVPGIAATLVLCAVGVVAAKKWRIPAGAMLVPMIVGAVLNSSGLVTLALPQPLLAVAYAALGFYVGLQFSRDVVIYALKALPQLVLAILLLMGLCGFSAWALTGLAGVTPLTAYLATSPGGLDSIAVIAVGSQADVPFVLALQTLRLFSVILTGPLIARLICRWL